MEPRDPKEQACPTPARFQPRCTSGPALRGTQAQSSCPGTSAPPEVQVGCTESSTPLARGFEEGLGSGTLKFRVLLHQLGTGLHTDACVPIPVP